MAKLTSKARNKLPASKKAREILGSSAKSKIDARAHKMLKTTKV